jgi:phosphopantothenoylcysteine decarboxylase/phosphopantothenate--cysteine ligase
MNNHMYEHAATQANLALLRERGVIVVDPGTGALGSKHEWGIGRLAEPAELLDAVEAVVPAGGRPWDGLKVLVTAGGTREPIDSVRFVGNRSSGRMGFALAEESAALGATVTVIAANVALERNPRVRYVDVATAAELKAACEAEFERADVLLMAAAVADYRPSEAAATKLKKDQSDTLTLTLERTDDIISALAAGRRPEQTIVGFAAEHGEGAVERGRAKLVRKALNAVVVNDISRADIGFDSEENEVTIVLAAGEREVGRRPKAEVAAAILDEVEHLRSGLETASTVEPES